MKAYKGHFDAAIATGAQTVTGIVDEDGNAFTPKALLVWGVGTNAAGFQDGYQISIGMTDGTNTMSAETAANDNSATSNAGGGGAAGPIIRLINQAATVQRSANFTSFASGQFTINWTSVTGTADKFHFLALGGTDLEVLANRGRMDGVRSQLSSTVFPKALITTCAVSNSGAGGIGFLVTNDDDTFSQSISLPQVRDSVNPSQTRRLQRTGHLRWHMTSSFGNFIVALWDQLGPAFAVLNSSSSVLSHDLILDGIAAKHGTLLQPTSAGTQAITGLGFSPKCVILVSIGFAATTNVENEAQLCIGAADRTRQGYTVAGALNGVSPSACVRKSDESKIVCGITPNATAASSTTQSEATLQSIDADGFTLNWGTADATQRQVIYLALGDEAAGGGGGGEVSNAVIGAN